MFMLQYWKCLLFIYYILSSVYIVCKLFIWNSLFLERKKNTYFDLIRVICFKRPYILRIINVLTTNCAYLLYKGWMYVWERMCVELGEYCCHVAALWGWGLFLLCRICTPLFLINWFLQWKTAVPHITKGINMKYLKSIFKIS